MTEAPEKASRKIFWGWYVVAGAFTIFAINYGARYCFGVFLKPMCEDLGWSRSVVSFAASLGVLFYGIGGILSGRLLDHFAPRWIITAGALSAALGFILTRFVSTPVQFYLAYGVLFGLGSSCLGVVVGNSSVGQWFIRKRGIALAISTNGAGAGMLIVTPLAGVIVQSFDWQMGFTVLGITVFLLCTALAQIFMGRTHPEDYGLLPDGDATRPIAAAEAAPRRADVKAAGRPVTRRLLTDGRFWIIASCFNVAVAVEMCAFTHQIAHAEGYGINPVAAAASMGIVSVASIAGRFFFGWLCDRISDVKLVASLGFLFMAAGMGIILFAKSLAVFYLYSAVIGFGWGSTGVMMPILIVDRFGRQVMGTAYGLVVFVAVGLGGSIGPVFGGLIYDRFGSYFYAWLTNLVCLIAVSLLMLSLKKGKAASI